MSRTAEKHVGALRQFFYIAESQIDPQDLLSTKETSEQKTAPDASNFQNNLDLARKDTLKTLMKVSKGKKGLISYLFIDFRLYHNFKFVSFLSYFFTSKIS